MNIEVITNHVSNGTRCDACSSLCWASNTIIINEIEIHLCDETFKELLKLMNKEELLKKYSANQIK